jgi:endoglucanase
MNSELLAENIEKLCRVMSVTGFEYRAADEISKIYARFFDGIESDRVGNHILIKRCGKENAPRILIDAHFDEVGMIVADVLEGGFLKIVNVGGIDRAIMQAADVIVYGKETLRGVVGSMPPHLRMNDDGKLPPIDELVVDMGYPKDELEKLVPIGTPVGFAPCYSRFGEGYMAGKSFDDKACAAIAAMAIIDTPKEKLAGDVYLCLSAREESSRDGGISPVCFNTEPDYAMVIDVNLGSAPDAPDRETVEMGKGISVSHSAATHRGLTNSFIKLCEAADIPTIPCAAPSSTGTNATSVNLSGLGIPVVDVGLPLRNMHTYNEVLILKDCEALYKSVVEFICSEELAKGFGDVEVLL